MHYPPFTVRSVATALVLSTAVVAFLYFTTGFYWEDTMTLHPAVIYGCITAPPFEAWFGEALLFQVPVLAHLAEWFPHLPVVGWWVIGVLILIYGVWLLLAYSLIRHTKTLPAVTAWPAALLGMVPILSVSLVYIHFSRLSILLVSGLLLCGLWSNIRQQKNPVALLLLFVFSLSIRVSTGILVLALGTLFFGVYTKSVKNMCRALRYHWLAVVMCTGTVLAYKYTSHNTGVQAEQTYEYIVSDSRAMAPLQQMHTTQDTMRYRALINYFLISDTAQISMGFIKQVADFSSALNSAQTFAGFQRLTEGLAAVWKKYNALLLACLLTALSAAWGSGWVLLLWVLTGGAVVSALALKVSIPEYFLLPWITVIFLYTLFWSLTKPINSRLRLVTGIGLLAIAVASLPHLQNTVETETDYNRSANRYLNNIAALSGRHQTPVIWDYGFLSFPSSIFSRTDMAVYQNCIFQTQFALIYYNFGQQRCLKITGCSPLNFRCMNEVFNKNKSKYCFVMEEHTAEFLKQYYKVLYNLEFNLVKEQPPNEITPGNFVFRLE